MPTPPAFSQDKLIALDMPPYMTLKFGVDPATITVTGDGPLVVRVKEFDAEALTLAQALDEMELVGHDFFLYKDSETGAPSVVYRRKAYNYGVIHLHVND